MIRIACKKVFGALRPLNGYAEEQLAAYADGAILNVNITQDRSGPHHNLFFAMLGVVAKGCGRDADELLDVIKMETGVVNRIRRRGRIEEHPGSIAWKNMDQAKFNKFFNMACDVIEEEVGVKQPVLMDELRYKFPDIFADFEQWRQAA